MFFTLWRQVWGCTTTPLLCLTGLVKPAMHEASLTKYNSRVVKLNMSSDGNDQWSLPSDDKFGAARWLLYFVWQAKSAIHEATLTKYNCKTFNLSWEGSYHYDYIKTAGDCHWGLGVWTWKKKLTKKDKGQHIAVNFQIDPLMLLNTYWMGQTWLFAVLFNI